MKCHKNENGKKSNTLKHILMMVFCCGLPILILAILPFINIGTGVKGAIAGITPFICPIIMLLMIPMMFKGIKGSGRCCVEKNEANEEIKKI